MSSEMEVAEVSNKLEILRAIQESFEYTNTKLAAMEQRQCDSEARGTDAARMSEQWASGAHLRPPKFQKIRNLQKSVLGQNMHPNPFQRGQNRVPQVRTPYAHPAEPLPTMIPQKNHTILSEN